MDTLSPDFGRVSDLDAASLDEEIDRCLRLGAQNDSVEAGST